MKKKVFKKQVITIHTMGLTAYCETECGQFRKEGESINKYDYKSYEDWASSGKKWGYTRLGKGDENGVTFAVMLPHFYDDESIVSLCAGLAFQTIANTCPSAISGPMLSRLAGAIYTNLMLTATEEIEEEDEK